MASGVAVIYSGIAALLWDMSHLGFSSGLLPTAAHTGVFSVINHTAILRGIWIK